MGIYVKLLNLIVLLLLARLTRCQDFEYDFSEITSSPVVSSTLVPTPTKTTSTPGPEPTPTHMPPHKIPFLRYNDTSIFVNIDTINVTYENVMIRTHMLTHLKANDTVDRSGPNTITFKRYYLHDGENHFKIAFTFSREDTGTPMWRVQNFQHQNLSNSTFPLFQYKGTNLSIFAPINKAFKCTDLEFHGTGTTYDGGTIRSNLIFKEVFVEAFLKNGNNATEYVSCADNSPFSQDIPIGLIVGLVIGGIVIIIILVIIIVITVISKSKKKEYDLLSD